MLSIAYLADYPQYLPNVAGWDFNEWGHHSPTKTVQDYEAAFRSLLNRDTIPLTVIGLWDGIPAGMSSIFVQDMDIHPELTPWLAAVYVSADYRDKGIGSKLVGAIEEIAARLRIARLHLWTPDKEHFYSRLGWSVLERPVYFNQPVALMSKAILPD